MKVKAKDLKLADVVLIPNMEAFNTVIVKEVGYDFVCFWRAYGVTEDSSCDGSVICYVRTEEFDIARNDHEYEVIERKELK